MMFGKYDESKIIAMLKGHAEIDAFYIYQSNDSGLGTVRFFDKNKEPWSLIIDDDDMYISCLNYLKFKNAPIFLDEVSVKKYEETIKASLD